MFELPFDAGRFKNNPITAEIVGNSTPLKVISKPLSPMMLVVYGELTKGKMPL